MITVKISRYLKGSSITTFKRGSAFPRDINPFGLVVGSKRGNNLGLNISVSMVSMGGNYVEIGTKHRI